jgi:hypothetical protein
MVSPMRAAALPVLLLTACAAKPAATTTTISEVDDGDPARYPAHYAALFEPGKSWTYHVETTHSIPDEPPDVEKVMVRCKVAGTGAFDGGTWSQIDCDGDFGQQQPVAGVWVADARGLYRLDAAPGTAAELDPAYLRMPAAPEASSEDIIDDPFGDGPQPIGSRSVSQEGDGWCFELTTEVGDAAWDEQCFGPEGIVKGAVGWSGGSDHETKYELAP